MVRRIRGLMCEVNKSKGLSRGRSDIFKNVSKIFSL
uniref:Uncharacterized protein n=1 Tax=Anguilla anguilla TaxID=7936 RepID=A0A0E9TGB1_ANGAN